MRRAGLLEMLKHQSISSGHGPFGDGAAAAAAANAASGGGKLACSTPLSCGETLSSFSATPFMMTSPRAQRSLPMASVPRSQKRHSMQLALQVSSCSGSGGDDGTRAAATGRIGPGRLRLFAGLSANTAACRAGASVSPPQLPPTLSPSCSSVRSALHFDSADCAAPATDAPHGPPAASRRRQPGRLALRGVHVGPCHSHEHAAYDASTGLAARTCLALECDNGGRDGRVEEPVCFAASESRTVGSLMPAGWPQSEGQGYEDATLAMPWAPEQQHWQQQEQQQQQQPLLPYTDPAAGGPVCCGAASTAATGCDVDGSDADEDEWEWLLSKIPDPPPAQGSVADNLLGAFAAEYAGRNGAGDGARATDVRQTAWEQQQEHWQQQDQQERQLLMLHKQIKQQQLKHLHQSHQQQHLLQDEQTQQQQLEQRLRWGGCFAEATRNNAVETRTSWAGDQAALPQPAAKRVCLSMRGLRTCPSV